MKKRTRFTALLLALMLLGTCLAAAIPVGAAKTTTVGFSDVTDTSMAADIECLRLMGVLDGYSSTTFQPGGTLTRAQFCKMAVYAMNASSLVGQYQATTVYPDVKPSHWASAYINLAAKGKKIISGYPNGNFYPDRTVTYAQAATILVRLLGYADADVGAVWPDSYLAQAKASGLTEGLSLKSDAALTRGQAAILFRNLLTATCKAKGTYGASIATTAKENVVLISSNATTTSGSTGAIQLADGTTYQIASGKAGTGLLNGHEGTLLLDQEGRALTFVPTSTTTATTITVAKAEAGSLTAASGHKFTMTSDIAVYYNSKQSTWGEAFSWLTQGTIVTLYFNESGNVSYLFAGISAASSKGAVVVSAQGDTTGFSDLAGTTDYTIYKDGLQITAGELRKYDVATYDSATNSIRVCDNRVSGYYENCAPNTTSPTSVTLMGYIFTTTATAGQTLSRFSLGNQITLLLTEDNRVAGAVSPGLAGNSVAVGVATAVSSSKASVQLLCGITVSGTVSMSAATAKELSGQLVSVSSGGKGILSIGKLTGNAYAAVNVTSRKMGTDALSDAVRIYELNGGMLTPVTLNDLPTVVNTSDIVYAAKDWAGRVNILVLGGTGSGYIFGRVLYTPPVSSGDSYTNASISVESGGSVYGPFVTGQTFDGSTYIGLKGGSDGKLESYMTLTKLAGVSNSAWIGQNSVVVSGTTYAVPSSVLCYNTASKQWVTLDVAHSFAGTSNLYVDSGNVVRIVEVTD